MAVGVGNWGPLKLHGQVSFKFSLNTRDFSFGGTLGSSWSWRLSLLPPLTFFTGLRRTYNPSIWCHSLGFWKWIIWTHHLRGIFLPSNSNDGGDNFIPFWPTTTIWNASLCGGSLLLCTQSKMFLTSSFESLRAVDMIVLFLNLLYCDDRKRKHSTMVFIDYFRWNWSVMSWLDSIFIFTDVTLFQSIYL